jgi:heptaprenyl diphosphate synthase
VLDATRKTTYLSLLISLGVVLHVMENWFGVFSVIPGGKLGLANVVALVALTQFGAREGLWVTVFRSLIGGLLAGTFPGVGFLMGFLGAVAGVVAMALLVKWRSKTFSLIGISIMGAMTNNLAQLLVFYLVVGHLSIFVYLPYLILFAVFAGLVVGLLALMVQGALQKVEKSMS